MYTIGIDLAITAAHKAIVAGAGGKFITPTAFIPHALA
jgi:hypothetical protein